MRILVTGGGRLHRLQPRRRAARRGPRAAGARQLLDRAAREPRSRRRRRRRRRGRPALLRARELGGPRLRRGLPPGCDAVGAALGAGSADLERDQHRRDAERAAGRARRRRAPRRVRLVVLGLRRRAGLSARRDAGHEPARAVRGLQARGRAVLPGGAPRLRPGDRLPALLQRLRAPPGPVLAVQRGDPEVHHRDASPARRPRSTATARSRATSRTSTTSWRRTCWRSTRRRRRGRIYNIACGRQVSLNELVDAAQRDLRHPARGRVPRPAARRRQALARRRRPRRARARLPRRRRRSTRACGARSRPTSRRARPPYGV